MHPRSYDWISSTDGSEQQRHADSGPSYGEQPVPYGIPFDVADGSHPKVEVDFPSGAPEEKRRRTVPLRRRHAEIEGAPDATGDRHAPMIDRDDCVLYELFEARWNDGEPTAYSVAVFDLGSNDLRPDGLTSADAAGLPIFPGLVRHHEVEAGEIDQSYLWPARHPAEAGSEPKLPPMGAWFRLRGDFDISGFRPRHAGGPPGDKGTRHDPGR